MKKIIYIAGKVTGVPVNEAVEKFATAQRNLEARGWEVINPMVIVTDRETPWQEAMDICMTALEKCNALYALPCSVHSIGAKMEIDFALFGNFDIYYELENIEIDEPINHVHSQE